MINSHLLYQLSYRGTNNLSCFTTLYLQEINGGGGEIRTLGRLLTYASFQDWCIKPLCHPSVVERGVYYGFQTLVQLFF